MYIMSHDSHYIGLKGQSFFFLVNTKAKAKRSNGFSSSFIQKIKVFNISNASVSSHMESLGNFKKKWSTKQRKRKWETTYIIVYSKKKRKKRKERKSVLSHLQSSGDWRWTKKKLLRGATPASSSSSSFSPSSLFSFLTNETFRVSAQYPFTGRNNRIWPVWSVFFPVRNKGVICTGALVGTVTELTSLA